MTTLDSALLDTVAKDYFDDVRVLALVDRFRSAQSEPEPCRYPACVDNGPEGKCTRWLLAECSKSSDFKPHRSAEPVRGPVAGPAKSVHDKVYSEVELADAYQKGWNHAMLRRSLGPHGIKEGA
jgi:hypothetical protein